MNENPRWWQKAVFYQIYPRSFADGNGDGIGDFKGLISKLDYLKGLGIDAIWLSPHYPSPYIDCGYDISNYRDVAPEYGDLGLFKKFLSGLHERGIRLVLDLVLNHTSDQHPWFLESRTSLHNSKRDWFIWKKGEKGQAPNNWYSTFGGSAWELDPATDEYYYHFFFKEQPDLNWKNPAVQEAMFNEARFWLDIGVDGFRLDAVGTIFEDQRYLNWKSVVDQEELFKLSRIAKSSKDHKRVQRHWMELFKDQVDQPEVHQITKDLRKVVDEYKDRVLIGETDDVAFYGTNDELHLNFNFPLMRTNKLSAEHIRKNQRGRLSLLPAGAWPCNTLGNHDSERVFSKFGDGEHNEAQARLNLLLLLSLKGTPFLYNGEEIGMSDYLITDPKKFVDPLSALNYDLEKRLMKTSEDEAVLVGAIRGRDKCRTPLQWSNSINAGFCPIRMEPWLPVNPDFQKGINIEEQDKDLNSLLNYYRFLLKFRRMNTALSIGNYQEIETMNKKVFIFSRNDEKQVLLVALNFSNSKEKIELSSYDLLNKKVVVNTLNKDIDLSFNPLSLFPFQGIIIS